MATLKKNATNQIMFTMVDKTDFASIESALVYSNMKCRIWGVNHGGSTATSTLSLAAAKVSLITSGIFRAVLPAINRDAIMFRASSTGTVSCAIQLMTFDLYTKTDSQIHSLCLLNASVISDIQSAIDSQALLNASWFSDIDSALTSQATIHTSWLSDIDSALSSQYTKTYSQLTGASATLSDIQSGADSQAVLNASWFSDIDSALSSQYTKVLSQATLASSRALVIQSNVSDLDSALTSRFSDLHSFISTTGVTVSNSAMSDISSRVWAASTNNVKMASIIGSQVWANAIGARAESRVTLVWSNLSDVQSALDSQYLVITSYFSDIQSAADSQALLNASWFSDINSGMDSQYTKVLSQATLGSSRALVNQSVLSDIQSAADSQALLNASWFSDIDSALTSRFSDLHSFMSTTGVGLNPSMLSDLRSAMNAASVFLQASDYSDILSAIAAGPAATITAQDISDIASRVWAVQTVSDLVSKVWACTYTAYKSPTASQFGARMVYVAGSLMSAISDLDSAVDATATASDVASKVWAAVYSDYSTGKTFGSLFHKKGDSGFNLTASDISDIRSAVAAGPTTGVTVQNISDIASRVWSEKYTTHGAALSSFGSGFRVLISNVSDIQSALDSQYTKVYSGVNHAVSHIILNASMISDIQSGADSQALLNTSWFSDIDSALSSQYIKVLSQATLGSSRALVNQSVLSDIQSGADSQALLHASWFSDIDSALSSQYTKVLSQATRGASVAVLNASSISDVDSALSSNFTTTLSRITGIVPTYTQLLIVQSMLSDVQSSLDSQYLVSTSWFSDIDSALSSQLIVNSSWFSDIDSALSSQYTKVLSQATLGSSRALVLQSNISDLDSALTSRFSDLHSFMSTTGVGLNASMMSDLRSAITAGPAAADTLSIASAVWAHATASDLYSKVGAVATLKTLGDASMMSDIRSAITAAQSDINSHVSGVTATVDNASVASAVWAHAIAASLVSRVSDVQSALDSQYTKVYSAVQAGGLTADTISDIASAVWADATAASLVSRVSDIQSALDSQALISASWLSNIDSALSSQYTKVLSQATLGSSRTLVLESSVSDVQSALDSQYLVLTSTLSDIDSAITSQYTAGFNLTASAYSDIQSRVDVCLNTAFTDSDSPTTNSLKERVRTMGWILRNKMAVIDASGNMTLYKDDNVTTAFTVGGALLDDGTTTTRKRIE